jgi:uroporphyrinogen-III decarboxylase
MVKPHNLKEFQEADSSHRLASERMLQAAKEQGEQGVRAVQIFQTLAGGLLEPDEVMEYALDVQSRANAAWDIAKAYEVQSLDATAAAMGVTRQSLLDQMASAPPTF